MTSIKQVHTPEIIADLQHCQLGYAQQSVLHDVNLRITTGESIAILGKSGAGKSTLLNHLFQQKRKLNIALIPQDYGLVTSLSVFHNVYMGALQRHSTFKNLRNLVVPQAGELSKVKTVLQQVQLAEKLYSAVQNLSGGEKQRVALARALYQNASILFADEPVSAVDGKQSTQLLQLANSHFSTLVCILHDIELALKYCSRIIGIHNGRVVIDSHTENLDLDSLIKIYE